MVVALATLDTRAQAPVQPPIQVGGGPVAPTPAPGLINPLPGAPTQCPPNTLPQYCQLQQTGTPAKWPNPPGVTPYSCPLGDVQCLKQQQVMFEQMRLAMASGCAPGPGMFYCMHMRKLQLENQRRRQNQEQMQKIMPLLNAITQMLGGGGGGGGGQDLANGGERMAMVDGSGGVTGYGGQDVGINGLNGNAPILEPFKRHFPKCTEKLGLGTCNFKFLGTYGDAAHRARRSCHNAGEAIDVGLPFTCSNGATFNATDPRAMDVARCMAGDTGGELAVIFQDRTDSPGMIAGSPRGAHNGHMHIQLKNCRMVYGGG